MEPKDEVNSDDDGSYELVDVDNNMGLSDEDSYDLLSSDMSDTPQAEDSNNTTVNEDNISAQIESFSHDPTNDDQAIEDSSDSDEIEEVGEEVEVEEEEEEEEELEMEVEEEQEQDLEQEEEGEEEEEQDLVQEEEEEEVTDCNRRGRKRNFMTMAYDNTNYNVYDFPSHIKLKEDMTIKDMAKTHIIRYLPAKSLAKCKSVSKEWDSWIQTPFFKHIQGQSFNQTSGFFQNGNERITFISLDKTTYGVPSPTLSFLPQEVFVRSSCHGLLLCQSKLDESEYFVCNPATKQFITLPNSSYYHGKQPKIVLAFEPSSLNFEPFYQVICPLFVPGEGPILYFDIYDSDTKAWRISEEVCVDLADYDDLKKDGVFVSGVAYWELTGDKLLAFDLKNEIYSVQTLPKEGGGGALLKVHGEVCYVKGHYRRSTKMCEFEVYDLSLMTSKSKICFGVPFRGFDGGEVVACRVLGNPCGDVVAVVLKKSKGQNYLFVYRMKDDKVQGPWFLGSSNKLHPYVNSLVSIAV